MHDEPSGHGGSATPYVPDDQPHVHDSSRFYERKKDACAELLTVGTVIRFERGLIPDTGPGIGPFIKGEV